MSFPKETLALAAEVVALAADKKVMVTTAESCTGGLVSGALTEIPGSSECLMGAYVTYSNYMKTRVLGVSGETLEKHRAVSEATAREMAEGALRAASADAGIAITGIAGPDGGSKEKPVGLVHFASARRVGNSIHTHHEKYLIEKPDRSSIRQEAVRIALSMLLLEVKHI